MKNFPKKASKLSKLPQFQAKIDVSDAAPLKCECGHEFFDICFRLGKVSKMSSRNPTGKDVLIKFETYLCLGCGKEYKPSQ